MRFGSVCSGIEAASVAWHPLGWRAAWFSEIEPFPCAVLAHHYPEVPNHGDMTALPQLIRSGKVEAPDLFCGGTPCQAFSVAGLRRSLDDERGNLSLTFVEIADAIDDVRRARGDAECIVFWENVPGVLSTQDNAFGCFLGAVAGCDTAIEPLAATGWTDAGVVAGPVRTVAWRVLDAQYFGLAQRRRRVFVVASAREGFDPAAVLLEWEGVRRDSAPSREAGKVAPTIPARSTGGGGLGTDFDLDGGVIQDPVVATIDANYGRLQGCSGQDANHGHSHLVAFGGNRTSSSIEVAPALLAQPGSGWKGDFESETFVTMPVLSNDPATAICANEQRTYTNEGSVFQLRNVVAQAAAYAVRTANTSANGHGVSAEMAHTLDQAQGQAVAFAKTHKPMSETDPEGWSPVEAAPTITHWPRDRSDAGTDVAVVAPTLTASNDPSRSPQSSEITAQVAAITAAAMKVRRLTPRECERLQGFPDDHTLIPWRGKPAAECPDGPRYKALGNSWAVPVVRWIGHRIAERIA